MNAKNSNKKRRKERLFLIDGSSYIFRAFYALPYLSNSRGLPTNAIYGFTNMILKVIREHKPDHMAVVFDAPGPTFRENIYIEYKAQRQEMPDELRPQLPFIKDIVTALRIPVLEMEGYEADDIIGTLAMDIKQKGIDIIIVTGDKDMLQLVNDHVTILDTMKNREFGVKDVMDRYGVEPSKVTEIMGLAGDSIDNIPGVPGIGEKTASKLIRDFGSIEKILDNIEKIPNRRVRENLEKYRDQAILSRKLASIETGVPIKYDYEEFKLKEPDYMELRSLLQELEFNRLLKEIIPASSTNVQMGRYITIKTVDDLHRVARSIKEKGRLSIHLYPSRTRLMEGSIDGIALSCSEKEVYFISGWDERLPIESALDALKPILVDEWVKKCGYDLKSTYISLKEMGIRLSGMDFDTMIASYLLNPLKAPYGIEDISEEYLKWRPFPLKKRHGEEEVKRHVCDTAGINYALSNILLRRLREEDLLDLFYSIEMPLVEVLSEMEFAGIKVDKGVLNSLSEEFKEEMERIEERIYYLAGRRFNINSPRQLQKVLFEDLKLKPVKRTKTGFSTDEEVLKALSLGHELPMDILNFRHIGKLKSTYVDGLISMIHPRTGRIHTSFNQATTATGRLSSSEPNLQNIPIRSELGKRIREVFIAEEGGNLLLSADYSQIELRLVAHLSRDPLLIEAFRMDEDIHRKTAAEVFHVFPEMVTEEMRRRAKAINFGIIYGISPYGLSQSLGVSQRDAKEYIDKYFTIHRGVKEFIEKTLEEAESNGYVSTLFGRKRPIPELKGRNPAVRLLGERIAINTPIQGTAADIIKKAMISIHRRLKERGLKTRMVLQIHDELLFEVPEKELKEIKTLVKEGMEGVVDLLVPIKVDIGIGRNWRDAH